MNRLFKTGLYTTLIGIAILIASFYMWITQKASQVECYTMAGMGIVFLRINDTAIPGFKKKNEE